jgi:uncharacterized damage-inducible protein DinB
MTECARLADQLRRSYAGPAWHGPALTEILQGVTAARAQTKPIPAAHSVWELVDHIATWQAVAIGALAGQVVPENPPDWRPIAQTADEAWAAALDRLRDTCEQLAAAIERLPDSKLEEIVPGRQYAFAALLHGVPQHNLYHAGQIAVLLKAC